MAGEERFLSSGINAIAEIDGVSGFIENLQRSGGNPERKKIGINSNGFIMEQSAERNPFEWEGTLLAPQASTKNYISAFKPGTVLNRLYTGMDDSTDIAKGGDAEISECNWDAAVLENDVLKVTIKIRQLGYGTNTQYTSAGGGGGGSGGGG